MTNKLDSETALAKIKVLIGDYYESIGRGWFNDNSGGEQQIIEDIDEVLDNTEIDMKKVIIERLELDKLVKGVGGRSPTVQPFIQQE